MTTPTETTADELSRLFDDSAARTEPLEDHYVVISGPLVVYTGPGKVAHPWSMTEAAARTHFGLEKNRDKFDAIDQHTSNLFPDHAATDVEIKACRIGRGRRSQSTGRICVRESQHKDLLDAGGDYVLVTYEQIGDRLTYIGDHVRVSAETMDDLIQRYAWSARDSAGVQSQEVRVPWVEIPGLDSKRTIREAYVLDYAS